MASRKVRREVYKRQLLPFAFSYTFVDTVRSSQGQNATAIVNVTVQGDKLPAVQMLQPIQLSSTVNVHDYVTVRATVSLRC